MDALYRTLQAQQGSGFRQGVIVDAKDAASLPFLLQSIDFLELPRIERRLLLPMGTVEQLFR